MGYSYYVTLCRFFGGLVLKEHLLPNLHVRPLVAELFLTDNCNLRCVSCACWRETTHNELSTEEWCGVIDQLAAEGIVKLNFTGGEPLLRKDAVELMAYAGGHGCFRELHLNTNAILLTPEMLEKTLEAGVRSFNISVDGPSATLHDRIRGRSGAFDLTMGHLEAVIARRELSCLRIRMMFTVMRDNVESVPAMMELAQRLGVRLYLNLTSDHTFLFRHRDVTEQSQIDHERLERALSEGERLLRRNSRWLPRYADLEYVRKHFSEQLQKSLPCAESQLKLMIRSQGDIGGCWAHGSTFNVRRSSIAETIESPEYRRQHSAFFTKDCVGCGSNYSLNLRWRPSSLVRDALWRLGLRRL